MTADDAVPDAEEDQAEALEDLEPSEPDAENVKGGITNAWPKKYTGVG